MLDFEGLPDSSHKHVVFSRKNQEGLISKVWCEHIYCFAPFFCRYKNIFKFIDLIESPGIAHVINTASYTEIGSHTLLAAILGVWPIASVTMVTVCLAGVVIWMLVSFDCFVIQVTLNCSF